MDWKLHHQGNCLASQGLPLYIFLRAPLFIFRHTSFNPRVSVSPPPDRNDRTTLPISNRNPNWSHHWGFPSPKPNSYYSPLLHRSVQSPFSLDAAVTRGLRWRKASTCVRPLDRHDALWNHPDRQVTAKSLTDMSKQTDWPWLESNSYPMDSGLQLVVLANALTIWASGSAIMETFSCILFLCWLYLSLNICYFMNFTLKYLSLRSINVWFKAPISDVAVEPFGGKWLQNVKRTSWRHARESSYTPWYKTTFPDTGQSHGNSGRVCKKIQA